MPEPLSPLFQDLYLKGLFDSQKWPDDWKWEGIHTRSWMKNFVVTTVNGYAFQPIYHSGADEWKITMDKYETTQKSQPLASACVGFDSDHCCAIEVAQ